jgi:hypothetical protein
MNYIVSHLIFQCHECKNNGIYLYISIVQHMELYVYCIVQIFYISPKFTFLCCPYFSLYSPLGQCKLNCNFKL